MNIKNKKKIKNIPLLPKVPSTLSDNFTLPAISNTYTKQKMKKVKNILITNESTIATSSFKNCDVEKEIDVP